MEQQDGLSSSPTGQRSLVAGASSTPNQPHPNQQQQPSPEPNLDSLDELGVSALFASLGFPFYDKQLIDHGITGEILAHLDHEALRDVGISSVGQRLAILRAVWERKVAQNVLVEEGDWRPPEDMDHDGPDGPFKRHVLGLVSERDDRIHQLENEVARLHESLVMLREDTLRMSQQSSPALKGQRPTIRSPTSALFPHPLSNASTLPLPTNLNRARSPSHPAPPSNLALSNSLHASASGIPDSPRSPLDSPRGQAFSPPNGAVATSGSQHSDHMLGDSMFASASGALTPTTPTGHAPPDLVPTPNLTASTSSGLSRPGTSQRERSGDGRDRSGASPAGPDDGTNPYRSFRVTLEDPCYKVLPAALKKYKINDDWRMYALFICHGNTERCLAYDEKPLLLFQKLKEGNANPVFMLRHIKDIKSPIAVASAKHAARRDKRAANAGVGLDRPPTASRDGAVLTVLVGGGGMARPTRLHHPPVLLPVGGKEPTIDDQPPPSPRDTPGYCIAIYPYLAEREDEFDVAVGDTFVILAKTKGWWVVNRDLPGPVVDPRKSAWVPAGCLLETSAPPLSLPGASEYLASAGPIGPGGNAADLPIEPAYVVSVSTPGYALMDYDRNGSDELDVRKGQALRILKRYNHWSYAIKEDGQRGWLPSWFCSRASSTAAGGAGGRGDGTPTTPTTLGQSSSGGLARSASRKGRGHAEGDEVAEQQQDGGIVLGRLP